MARCEASLMRLRRSSSTDSSDQNSVGRSRQDSVDPSGIVLAYVSAPLVDADVPRPERAPPTRSPTMPRPLTGALSFRDPGEDVRPTGVKVRGQEGRYS